MDPDSERWHRQLRTGLTTIKLAVQLLQRRPGLGRDPGGPADKAPQAADDADGVVIYRLQPKDM